MFELSLVPTGSSATAVGIESAMMPIRKVPSISAAFLPSIPFMPPLFFLPDSMVQTQFRRFSSKEAEITVSRVLEQVPERTLPRFYESRRPLSREEPAEQRQIIQTCKRIGSNTIKNPNAVKE